MQKSSFLNDSEVNPREDNLKRFSNRVLAKKVANSKFCRAYDKAAAKKALATGQHPPRHDPHPEHFEKYNWEQHPEDDDFDEDEEEVKEEDCWIEEVFNYRNLHFCPMTILYYDDYMRRRNEWFERYFQDLYARRELEQAEKDYFTESCWDAILSECK